MTVSSTGEVHNESSTCTPRECIIGTINNTVSVFLFLKAALTFDNYFLSVFASDLAFSLKTKTIRKNAKLVKIVKNIIMQMIMHFISPQLCN